ncbi:methyltransferase domain-containing protein [Photobacterium damselae subsp. damselae]|uniref:class I SAM-dependent methyltransferase n=1 Tax=Photobacterium damselae TaxID=38293 RepID=UPI001EED1552|nr:class I SAM-dependent methyltransferase [Photobacterium damselae]UKA23371.1 methyltransferase domain-containing protein [Photobacterium damselae subsp. damselae]
MKIPTNWTFKDRNIANSFDSHVREQLPWYELASYMIAHIVRNYFPENGLFLDLGCSTGNISSVCKDTLLSRNAKILNIDNSQEMLVRFSGIGETIHSDIENYEIPDFDVCVLFLSLMFVPVSYREELIANLKRHCRTGGAIIIVDKVESLSGYMGLVLSRFNLSNKLDAGCTPTDVLAKELSISGIQRPLNPDLLNSFIKWFQVGEFQGWLYEAV